MCCVTPSALWKYLFHLCVLYATGLKVIALQTISFYLSEVFERSILSQNLHMVDRNLLYLASLFLQSGQKKPQTEAGKKVEIATFILVQLTRLIVILQTMQKKKKCCSLQWQVSRTSEPMWKENGANNLSLGNTVTHTSEQQLLPFLCCSTIIRMWYKFVHFFCCSYRRCAYVWYKLAKLVNNWFDLFN